MTSGAAPATSERERFREALEMAHLPTVIAMLVQLTGDLSWLDERYHAERMRGLSDDVTGGLPPHEQAAVRAAALEAILAWRAGAPVAIPNPSEDLVTKILAATTGDRVPAEFGRMFAAILAGAPGASVSKVATVPAPTGKKALIVGSGITGLAAAIRLRALGIAVTIVERRPELGGTWHDNRYPGAGVDVPSHLYSYSFAPHDWPHYFARRDEVNDYVHRVARDHHLRPLIRFRTDVVSARYDEHDQTWSVLLRDEEGSTAEVEVDYLISAVGAFSNPVVPDIPGLAEFEGPRPHTAGWPDDLDLTGKNVAVIGNGASAVQVVTAIAETVGSLKIFQRSPQWIQPLGAMKEAIPEPVRFLMREVDAYARWYRLRWAWVYQDKLHPSLQKDPDWPHPERSLNAVNDAHRVFFTEYIKAELADRPDLIESQLPTYPPFGKRILLDWGWYQALKRPNVELITTPIAAVGPDYIQTDDGAQHQVDVMAMATGFDVIRFVSSFEVIGRSGITLREAWDDDDGRAYLGLAVPGFPNFFCLYGPNTQPGHGGSLIHTVEAQIHYVCDLLSQAIEQGLGSVECRQDVFDEYNRRVDAAHEAMVWTHPGMTTYYRNSRGRVVVNMPFRNIDFWAMAEHAKLSDFHTEPRRNRLESGEGEKRHAAGVH